METFEATKFEEGLIELTSSAQIDELYKVIQKEENFVLKWTEGDAKRSEMIIGKNLLSKINTGDMALRAMETKR